MPEIHTLAICVWGYLSLTGRYLGIWHDVTVAGSTASNASICSVLDVQTTWDRGKLLRKKISA
jgi:hypothetical protein